MGKSSDRLDNLALLSCDIIALNNYDSLSYDTWTKHFKRLYDKNNLLASEELYFKYAMLLVNKPVLCGKFVGVFDKKQMTDRRKKVAEMKGDLLFAIKKATEANNKNPKRSKGFLLFALLTIIDEVRKEAGEKSSYLNYSPLLEVFDTTEQCYKNSSYSIKDFLVDIDKSERLYNYEKLDLRTDFGKGITFKAYGEHFATPEEARKYAQQHCGYDEVKGGSKK